MRNTLIMSLVHIIHLNMSDLAYLHYTASVYPAYPVAIIKYPNPPLCL